MGLRAVSRVRQHGAVCVLRADRVAGPPTRPATTP